MNKAAFGELTLGEVWDLVKDEVDSVVVEELGFYWDPLASISLDCGDLVFSDENQTPNFTFAADSRVRVMEDRVELIKDEDYLGKQLFGIHFLSGNKHVSLKFLLYSKAV